MPINLTAEPRMVTGKKVFRLRQSGKIPAVVYGRGLANKNLELNYHEFEKVFQTAGESTIIDLKINGEQPIKVLISETQFEPISHKLSHVDFHQIRMDEKIHAHIELKFSGESKLVKEENGSIIHNLNELEIKCLPADLIHEVEVDISRLQTFDDVITIADLKLPAKIEVIGHEPDAVVALAVRHKEEKEEEPAPSPEAAEVEAAAETEAVAATEASAEGKVENKTAPKEDVSKEKNKK